jgi:hypothetical protein
MPNNVSLAIFLVRQWKFQMEIRIVYLREKLQTRERMVYHSVHPELQHYFSLTRHYQDQRQIGEMSRTQNGIKVKTKANSSLTR